MPEKTDYINQIHDTKTRRALQQLLDYIFSDTFYLKQAGTATDRTAAQINLLVQGYAAGYKLARGSVVGTASGSLATGLTTVVDFAVSARADTATKANAAVSITGDLGSTAGNLKWYRWKHTNTTTNTLVAASTAGTLEWIAVGT